MKKEIKRVYRGWPGHCCISDKCRFRLNTLISMTGDTRSVNKHKWNGILNIVVSTIGAYYNDKEHSFENFAHSGYYETKVFICKKEKFLDIDVSKEVEFSSPWQIMFIGDKHGTNSDIEANNMHENVCAEIEQMMLAGTIKVLGEKQKASNKEDFDNITN